MKKMLKLLGIMAALAMVLGFGLTACSSGSSDDDDDKPTFTSTTEEKTFDEIIAELAPDATEEEKAEILAALPGITIENGDIATVSVDTENKKVVVTSKKEGTTWILSGDEKIYEVKVASDGKIIVVPVEGEEGDGGQDDGKVALPWNYDFKNLVRDIASDKWATDNSKNPPKVTFLAGEFGTKKDETVYAGDWDVDAEGKVASYVMSEALILSCKGGFQTDSASEPTHINFNGGNAKGYSSVTVGENFGYGSGEELNKTERYIGVDGSKLKDAEKIRLTIKVESAGSGNSSGLTGQCVLVNKDGKIIAARDVNNKDGGALEDFVVNITNDDKVFLYYSRNGDGGGSIKITAISAVEIRDTAKIDVSKDAELTAETAFSSSDETVFTVEGAVISGKNAAAEPKSATLKANDTPIATVTVSGDGTTVNQVTIAGLPKGLTIKEGTGTRAFASGAEFTSEGVKGTVTCWLGGAAKDGVDVTVTPPADMTNDGEEAKTVTVNASYSESGINLAATYEISIRSASDTVQTVVIDVPETNKTGYNLGDSVKTDGITVTATYASGNTTADTKLIITLTKDGAAFEGTTFSEPGTYTVTVSTEVEGVSATPVTFDVTIASVLPVVLKGFETVAKENFNGGTLSNKVVTVDGASKMASFKISDNASGVASIAPTEIKDGTEIPYDSYLNTGGDSTGSNIKLTIPAGGAWLHVLMGSNSDSGTRSIFIGKAASKKTSDAEEGTVVSSTHKADFKILKVNLKEGTWYLNYDTSVNIYVIEVTADDLGTITVKDPFESKTKEVTVENVSDANSSDESVATVEKGDGKVTVTSVKRGTAKITGALTDGGSYEFDVTVAADGAISAGDVTTYAAWAPGTKEVLATELNITLDGADITYSDNTVATAVISDDKSKVTITSAKAGTTKITLTESSSGHKATIDVTVDPAGKIVKNVAPYSEAIVWLAEDKKTAATVTNHALTIPKEKAVYLPYAIESGKTVKLTFVIPAASWENSKGNIMGGFVSNKGKKADGSTEVTDYYAVYATGKGISNGSKIYNNGGSSNGWSTSMSTSTTDVTVTIEYKVAAESKSDGTEILKATYNNGTNSSNKNAKAKEIKWFNAETAGSEKPCDNKVYPYFYQKTSADINISGIVLEVDGVKVSTSAD